MNESVNLVDSIFSGATGESESVRAGRNVRGERVQDDSMKRNLKQRRVSAVRSYCTSYSTSRYKYDDYLKSLLILACACMERVRMDCQLFRCKTVDTRAHLVWAAREDDNSNNSFPQEPTPTRITHHVLLLLHKWTECVEQGF